MSLINENNTDSQEHFRHFHQSIGMFINDITFLIKQQQDEQQRYTKSSNMLANCRMKWKNKGFQIGIFALIKAGKSTLINALLGNEFLPVKNVVETAHIVHVRHNPQDKKGTLFDELEVLGQGAENVNNHLSMLNERSRETGVLLSQATLILEAPLVALAQRSFDEQHFEILDTPGRNAMGVEQLHSEVDRLLSEVDVIVYVLDYTKLMTDDEQEMFEALAKLRPDILGQAKERLFFVVNKIDTKNRWGMQHKETTEYIAKMLKKYLNGFDIPPDRILLVSAERALLARLVVNKQASEKVIDDFKKKAFGEERSEDATLEECYDAAPRMLKKSGIEEFERSIISFIYSKRSYYFFDGLLKDIRQALEQFRNDLITEQGALQTDQDELNTQIKKIEDSLSSVKNELDRVSTLATQIQSNLKAWIEFEFEQFEQEIDVLFRNPSLLPFPKLTSDKRKKLERRIDNLHERIQLYLLERFEEFRTHLESKIYEKQEQLFEDLREVAIALSKQIEATIGKALQISLLPISIPISGISQQTLREQIDRKTSSFVHKKKKDTRITEQEKYWEPSEGWQGWFGGGEWKTRPVTRTEKVKVYKASEQEIITFWSEQIRELTALSAELIRTTIDEQLGEMTEQTCKTLEDYTHHYVNIMRSVIHKRLNDGQYAASRLQQVSKCLQQVNIQTNKTQDCQRAIVTLLGQVVTTSTSSLKRDQVFISYSHEDASYLKKLEKMLKPLTSKGKDEKIKIWADTQIRAGAEWKKEVNKALAVTKVAVLLVSPDFLASDFIANNELPDLLESAKHDGLTILWIAVRFCLYEETEIGNYRAVNDPSRPLEKLNNRDQEKELVNICKQIKSAMGS